MGAVETIEQHSVCLAAAGQMPHNAYQLHIHLTLRRMKHYPPQILLLHAIALSALVLPTVTRSHFHSSEGTPLRGRQHFSWQIVLLR